MSKIVGELNAEIMKKVIHDRRAKLFAEIVAKTGSKQSVIDRAMQEIESLREQVEKLTKERDALRSRRCEVCGYLEHEREHTGCLREQLAALAEQNEKMRKVLLRLACLGNGDQYGNSIGNCIAQEALSLPDLASPVLNRIRAEGMRMAAEIADMFSDKHSMNFAGNAAEAIRARAAELEKTNG